MAEQATVATRSKHMEAREAQRVLPRLLMIGESAVLAQASTYFPREPLEQPIPVITGYYQPEGGGELRPNYAGTIDPWQQRVDRMRGKLYNRFAEAVKDSAGQVFTKEPVISEDTPQKLKDFFGDVNGAGASLHTFALSRLQTAAAEGIDYVLVDYPPAPVPGQVLTESEEGRLGVRPTWKVYSPGSVLEVEPEMFRGNLRAKLVRLMETVEVEDGKWGKRCIEQVRVLYPGDGDANSANRYARFEVWRKPVKENGEEGEWKDAAIYEEGVLTRQVDIPFVAFPTSISEEYGQFDSPPPMVDLAWKVIGHARKRSTLDNSQHMVGFPFLYWAGIEEDSAKQQLASGLGSSRVLAGPKESSLTHTEPQGTAWESVERSITRLEQEMDILAKAPKSDRAEGAITARGEILGQARAQVQLESWATHVENAINTLAYYTWLYLDAAASPEADSGWGSVKLDCEILPDPSGQTQTAAALYTAMMEERMSRETWWEAWRRIGMPLGTTWDEELALINTQGPLGSMPEPGEDLTGAEVEVAPKVEPKDEPKDEESRPEAVAA